MSSITQHILQVHLFSICSSTDRQVAAESYEATAAEAQGSTAKQLKCMSVSFIFCQLHLSVISQDIQISEGSNDSSSDS